MVQLNISKSSNVQKKSRTLLLFHKPLLNICNGFSWIKILRTKTLTIHNCMASIQFKCHPLPLTSTSCVHLFNPPHIGKPALILLVPGIIQIPPVTRKNSAKKCTDDVFVHTIHFQTVFNSLKKICLPFLHWRIRFEPRLDRYHKNTPKYFDHIYSLHNYHKCNHDNLF